MTRKMYGATRRTLGEYLRHELRKARSETICEDYGYD